MIGRGIEKETGGYGRKRERDWRKGERRKKYQKAKIFWGVKLLQIQCGVLCPSSSARAVCCREGTAGSDAGEGVMGCVSRGFNGEK